MELFYYLLKVSACLVLFFGFYLLVLQKLTFFKFNRFYLLLTLLASFVIPSLQFTLERRVAQVPIMVEEPNEFPITEIQSVETAQPFVATEYQVEKVETINWLALIPYAYILVASMILSLSIRKLILLLKHIKQKATAVNGLKLVSKADGFTNCSFFNYVFIDDQSLTANELEILLQHESVHAKQYHSIDKIVLMLAKAVLWFNPVIYLWDKTLEQVHEYEADETTSTNFGSKEYASLLLKLAVEHKKPILVHNFVKSPVKERIKMLFNSKSKNMKKLMYLLVAPIALGLIWGFTVKVVEITVAETKNTKIDQLIEKTGEELWEKTIKGKIDSLSGEGFWRVIHLRVGDKVYPIKNDIVSKVKKGDELTVTISGRMEKMTVFDKQKNQELIYDTPLYLMKEAISSTGKVLIKAPEKHAFLFETNKVRFATSKIEKLRMSSAGYVSEIVLNDGKFKILIDVVELKTKAENFKIGDDVTVKFIGEKLISKNVYATNKLIALHSNPKKIQIINPVLYSKFYSKEGYQLIKGGKPKPLIKNHLDTGVKLVSASKATSNIASGITHFNDAKFEIQTLVFEGKEATMDNKRGEIIAKDAKVIWLDGKVKSAETIIYDMKKKTFTYYTLAKVGAISKDKSGNLELLQNVSPSHFPYYASDSTVVSRVFGWQKLYGNANLTVEKYKLMGKSIHIFSKEKMITIFDGSLKDDKDLKVEADIIEIDLAKKTYAAKSSFD